MMFINSLTDSGRLPNWPWHGRCGCHGMTKKTSLLTDEALLATVEQFVRQVLADGCNPAELNCALTTVAARIGLDVAPSDGIAFAVVMRAVSDDAGRPAESRKCVQHGEGAMRFKRKSD